MDGPGFESNLALLQQLMTLAANRQKVIAHNIANVNTPGYRRKELQFEEELLRAVEQQDFTGLRRLEGALVESDAPTLRNDGNNVDIDQEMAAMQQNSTAYSIYTELYAKHLELIQLAMKS